MIIGKKKVHYSEIDSTNSEARRLIQKGEGEGLVVIADRQTAGRGKPGSNWFSPEGNFYLSAVVKPRKNPKDLAPITLLGALAGRSAIGKFADLLVVIKWPNDLLIKGKKVGGILVERLPSGHLIIGIGLNLNLTKKMLPDEIRCTATSLRIETGKSISIADFAVVIIKELDREYLAYLSKI